MNLPALIGNKTVFSDINAIVTLMAWFVSHITEKIC